MGSDEHIAGANIRQPHQGRLDLGRRGGGRQGGGLVGGGAQGQAEAAAAGQRQVLHLVLLVAGLGAGQAGLGRGDGAGDGAFHDGEVVTGCSTAESHLPDVTPIALGQQDHRGIGPGGAEAAAARGGGAQQGRLDLIGAGIEGDVGRGVDLAPVGQAEFESALNLLVIEVHVLHRAVAGGAVSQCVHPQGQAGTGVAHHQGAQILRSQGLGEVDTVFGVGQRRRGVPGHAHRAGTQHILQGGLDQGRLALHRIAGGTVAHGLDRELDGTVI